MQIMNATTVHVRRPGNPKKWRARVLCEGIICDLALLTVDEPQFWSEDLMSLQFVAVPELQARSHLLVALFLSLGVLVRQRHLQHVPARAACLEIPS